MRFYCTYFDKNYLVKGLTLYRSLQRHGGSFTLWVLCLDEATFEALSHLALPELRPVRLADLESADRELHAARGNRSLIEYYFTLTPAWPLFLLERFPEVDLLTYVDSDLLFYSSPEPVFEELHDDAILIIGHRFPEPLRHLERYGVYNVGFVTFRNDDRGRECLRWWREQCLQWCHDRFEDGRFADQKYLDHWPGTMSGVRVLQHKGAGLAPWNWMNYALVFDGTSGTVDGEPLIFFHFHGFKIVNRWLFEPGDAPYRKMPRKLRRQLYGGYLRALAKTRSWLRSTLPGREAATFGSVRYAAYNLHYTLYLLRHRQLWPRVGFIPL